MVRSGLSLDQHRALRSVCLGTTPDSNGGEAGEVSPGEGPAKLSPEECA